MKGGTHIRLPDGRVGTITWNYLNGHGGIFGIHDFSNVPQNFDDGWPEPEFMLREKEVQKYFKAECVGSEYEIIE